MLRAPQERLTPSHPLAAFGSSTLNEQYQLPARKRGIPGYLPDCTREKDAFIARSRRTGAERASGTAKSRQLASSVGSRPATI